MEKYFAMLQAGGADLAQRIEAKSVVTAAWTVYKCRFGCRMFGRNHCCPPHSPSWKETREIIDCFQYGILFRCHDLPIVTPLAVETARKLFLDGYYKVLAFGSGPCEKCKTCAAGRCNFPQATVPAMEACGIDVFATVRNNGLTIETLREQGETENYFGLLLVE